MCILLKSREIQKRYSESDDIKLGEIHLFQQIQNSLRLKIRFEGFYPAKDFPIRLLWLTRKVQLALVDTGSRGAM